MISPRMLRTYLVALESRGYIKITPTKYTNSDGKRVYGHNEYTLKKVDDAIHAWQHDKPLLSVGEKFANTLNNNLTVIRTNSNDQSFSSKDSSVEIKKKKRRNTDPNITQDPKTWWPNGAAGKVLEEQYGPHYCAQEPIVSEFQNKMLVEYPGGLPRRLLNYKFIPFAKSTKPLRDKYGPDYMPLSMRKEFSVKQAARNQGFDASTQKTPIAPQPKLTDRSPTRKLFKGEPVEWGSEEWIRFQEEWHASIGVPLSSAWYIANGLKRLTT
jgi:hypothetical protein